MKVHVTGTLTSATSVQPSLAGCRIEAIFARNPAPTSSVPSKYGQTRAELLEDSTPTPDRVSALSNAAGHFTLVFQDPREIASEKVKIVVFSPAGQIVGELELLAADLGDPITIEVKGFGPTTPDRPAPQLNAPQLNTPQSVAVDALFRTDAALRRAITDNLKSLRGESEAIAARVEKAWKFNPSQLSAEELARRHYVAPGSDPGEVLRTVIMSGVDVLQSAKTERALTLRNTAELKKLIKNNQEPGDSLHGVVELDPLIEYIKRRGAGPFLGAELTSTPFRAEAEAEAILDAVGNGGRRGDGDLAAHRQALTSDARETEEFVRNTVNTQMKPATAPEAPLAYNTIPNNADQDEAQKTILQSFEPRKGPTDVISYHDFHTLRIAFQHVWTEIFDGQLASLGRRLYSEYVKLKDFSGSTEADLQVGTLADLRRLMDEVKKLSQIVQDNLPSDFRGGGGDSEDNNTKSPNDWIKDVETGFRGGLGVLTAGLSELILLALNEFSKIGQKRIIKWDQFPGPWWPRQDKIYKTVVPDAAPAGTVEVVLMTDFNTKRKVIGFHPLDAERKSFGTGPQISNADRESIISADRTTISTTLSLKTWEWEIASGVLQFASEETSASDIPGRYVLADLAEELAERTRVTFHWKDS